MRRDYSIKKKCLGTIDADGKFKWAPGGRNSLMASTLVGRGGCEICKRPNWGARNWERRPISGLEGSWWWRPDGAEHHQSQYKKWGKAFERGRSTTMRVPGREAIWTETLICAQDPTALHVLSCSRPCQIKASPVVVDSVPVCCCHDIKCDE